MKICMNCGTEINQLSNRVKFCSDKCKLQYHDKVRNSEYKDISVCCANCKKNFIKRTKRHSINYNVSASQDNFCSDK